MSKFGIGALALVAAVILGFGARIGTQTAHAEVDGSVAIGCEFLASTIDGDNTDATVAGDYTDACDGISAAEVQNLADALGDEDGKLEASDFEDIDLDDNQIQDGGSGWLDDLTVFAFVDNDETVTFDAGSGVVVSINLDTTGGAAGDGTDLNAETCDATDAIDLDCQTSTLDDGDGVVVATVTDGTGDPGDTVDVDISQADDPSTVSTQTVNIVGEQDDVTVEALKGTVQATGSTSDFDDCLEDSDVSDTGMINDVDKTVLKATVTDNDGVELTRIPVTFDVDDSDVADIDDDSGEDADEPKADTGETVNAGAAGIGQFAVVCGGTDTGTATFTATIDIAGGATTRDDSVDVTVVGEPATVALTADPAAIACDGTQTSTVTAKVTDSDGNNVANGTSVEFSVVALGTANPITAKTTDGAASSTITPLSGATAGVVVLVTAGDAQASIRIDCSLPIQPTTGPQATPTRPGGITGPDTGNGGYLGQDGSAGFPMWTLVALALGSVALVAGGMVTRKVSK